MSTNSWKEISDLMTLFREEKSVFTEIHELETDKTRAILGRDGKTIQKIAVQEESLLQKLSRHEKKRDSLVKALAMKAHRSEPEQLSDLLGWNEVPEDLAVSLKKEAEELAEVISRMQAISRNNQAMLEDNASLFHGMIQTLQKEDQVGYGPADKQTVKSRPLFVDANC